MSASRDKTQKTAFVYSNLYQLYRKGKEAASSAEVPPVPTAESESEARQSYFQLPNSMGTLASEKNVLKSADLKAEAAPEVNPYQPPSLLAKRIVDKPKAIQPESHHSHLAHPVQSAAIQSLKENLKTLNDLHSRLKFMLEELQELVKE
jgi:hypothetical protein